MSKFIYASLIAFFATTLAMVTAQTTKDAKTTAAAKDELLTHAQVAMELCNRLFVGGSPLTDPTTAFTELEAKKVVPFNNWGYAVGSDTFDPKTPTTVADLAKLIVLAKGWGGEVEGDASGPGPWLELLKEKSIPLDSGEAALATVRPRFSPPGPDADGTDQTGNPDPVAFVLGNSELEITPAIAQAALTTPVTVAQARLILRRVTPPVNPTTTTGSP